MSAYTAGPTARPKSVQTALMLIYVGIALSVIAGLVTIFLAPDNTEVSPAAQIPSVLIGVLIPIALAVFIGRGANWARIVYTVLSAIGILISLLGIVGTLALGFVVLALVQVVSLALTIAVLYFLYRPDSNAFFKS